MRYYKWRVSLRFGCVCEEDPAKILSDLKIYTTERIDTFFFILFHALLVYRYPNLLAREYE